MENIARTIDINNYKSVIAVDHSPARSEKFAFIPTTRVIDVLQQHGWTPAKISEKRSTKLSTVGYGTHLIRFRQADDQVANLPARVGDLLPEIVLKNAHGETFPTEMQRKARAEFEKRELLAIMSGKHQKRLARIAQDGRKGMN